VQHEAICVDSLVSSGFDVIHCGISIDVRSHADQIAQDIIAQKKSFVFPKVW